MTDPKKYRAQGCSPDSEGRIDHGVLWFTESGAHFRGDTINFTLPLESMRIDRGGATGDTIRMTSVKNPDYFISTTDLSMFREPLLVSRGDLRAAVKSGRRGWVCCLGLCVIGVLALVAIAIVLLSVGGAYFGF